MNVAVIPARGGSKRIPRKNIKDFCGKPMIAWSIEAALKSNCFDAVVVSTDDEEIADVSVSYGASVPFLRPASLSDDYTPTIPVIQHAIQFIQESSVDIDYVCCLYATAPFVSADDLSSGLDLIQKNRCDYAFTVTSYAFPIQRAIKLNAGGGIEMFQPDQFNARSQDLEEAFHDAGQFYWGATSSWLEGKKIFSPNSRPLLLPRHRVQDIDSMEDWVRAELMFRSQLI